MTEQLRYDGNDVIVTDAGNSLGRSHALIFGARGATDHRQRHPLKYSKY